MNNKSTIRNLFKSIESNNVGIIRHILQKGCDPSALLLPEGISAMHLVAGVENKDAFYIAVLLLLYGGNPNVRSLGDGFTPIHICAAWGHVDILKLFLKYGGDPNLRDNEGNNAINLATEYGHRDAVLIMLDAAGRPRCAGPEWTEDCSGIGNLSDISSQHNKGFCEESCSSSTSSTSSTTTWYTVDEYLCLDDQQKVAFIEQQCLPTSDDSASTEIYHYPLKSNNNQSSDSYKTSSSSGSIPENLRGLGDSSLIARLRAMGETPGPINATTRRIYLRRLKKLAQGCNAQPVSSQNLVYSPALANALTGKLNMDSLKYLENKFLQEFDNVHSKQKWRGGLIKSCFNYLLIDPRISQNLPLQAQTKSFDKCFSTFVNSIFYVGKGTNARPYDHLYEALRCSQNKKIQVTKKIQCILDIWKAGLGVVSLHCFQGSITVEALTREACLIDAIGLENLTNAKRGEYYGQAACWGLKKKCQLGVLFLQKAFNILLQEGERQIQPININHKI